MAAFSGFVGVGASITDGVLAEPWASAAYARQPIAGDLSGAFLFTMDASVSFGPSDGTWGSLGAWALFDAANDGTVGAVAVLPGISVAAGQMLTIPAGVYAMSAPSAIGADVVTLAGLAVTINGQPLTVH